MPRGSYAVMATHVDFAESETLDVEAGTSDVVVTLRGSGRLTGTVVRSDGTPAVEFS